MLMYTSSTRDLSSSTASRNNIWLDALKRENALVQCSVIALISTNSEISTCMVLAATIHTSTLRNTRVCLYPKTIRRRYGGLRGCRRKLTSFTEAIPIGMRCQTSSRYPRPVHVCMVKAPPSSVHVTSLTSLAMLMQCATAVLFSSHISREIHCVVPERSNLRAFSSPMR